MNQLTVTDKEGKTYQGRGYARPEHQAVTIYIDSGHTLFIPWENIQKVESDEEPLTHDQMVSGMFPVRVETGP
jgi:hypothetical protein